MTWRSVSEGLPDLLPHVYYSRDVIFCDEEGTRYIGVFKRVPEDSISPYKSYWQENQTGCGCCSQRLQATHWMEAPEVPK